MDIPRFEEFSNEAPLAGYGDWKPKKSTIGYKSAFVIKHKWTYLGDLVTSTNTRYGFYRSPNGVSYIAGDFITTSSNETLFDVAFSIKLTRHIGMEKQFGVHMLMNVDGVEVQEDKQGDGLAKSAYRFLVKKEGICLLSDEIQYFGARKLWKRLSNMMDLTVDVIDIKTDEYVAKDVTLHHGEEDWDFDSSIWSYHDENKHIRLLLKDIKD